jgi:hypothetical protein
MRGMAVTHIPAYRLYRYHPASKEAAELKHVCPTARFKEDSSLPYGAVICEVHLVETGEVLTPEEYVKRCSPPA